MHFTFLQKFPEMEGMESYKDFIVIPQYKDLLNECLSYIEDTYSRTIGEYEEKVARVFLDMMTYRGYLEGDVHSLMDPVMVAIYLHRILMNENDELSIFNVRCKLRNIFNESELEANHKEQILQCIEGQFGAQTDIQRVKPDLVGPQSDMAFAVWVVNNYMM